MSTIGQIRHRRSVRKYNSQPVSDEDVREILECAMTAPSAVNLQPWYFVVVSSGEGREGICDLLRETALNNAPHLRKRFEKHPEVVKETTNFLLNVGGAPVVVLVFENKKDYSFAGAGTSISLSIGAAIENLLLAADAKGIASCWMTAPLEAGLAPEFEKRYAPDHGKLVSMICLGYSDAEPKMPRRKDERVKFI